MRAGGLDHAGEDFPGRELDVHGLDPGGEGAEEVEALGFGPLPVAAFERGAERGQDRQGLERVHLGQDMGRLGPRVPVDAQLGDIDAGRLRLVGAQFGVGVVEADGHQRNPVVEKRPH